MKARILVIEAYCPNPADSGGKVRIGHTLRFLSHHFNIDLFAFFQNRSEVAINKTWFEKLNINPTFFQSVERHFFSYIKTSIPYWFAPWYSIKLIDKLKNTKYSQYNSVLVEQTQLLFVADYLPKTTKKIFVAHDVSTVSFWRRLSDASFLKKIIHFPRFLEVIIYENYYLKKYDHVVAVSQKDARFLKIFFRLRSVSVIENGIEKIDFINPTSSSNTVRLGYLGSPKHTPNKKSIDFITNKIYPQLNSKNFIVNLGGSDASPYTQKGIATLGFVPSTKKFFEQIDILIAPIFAGSGSRIKILESLSFGTPVITTKVGAEGLILQTPLLTIVPTQYQFSPRIWAKYIQSLSLSFKNSDYTSLASQLSHHQWSYQLEKFIRLLS